VLLAIGIAAAGVVMVADVRLDRAIESADPTRAESAARAFPGDAVVADVVAQVWSLRTDVDPQAERAAIRWSQRAVERDPYRPYYWVRLAIRQAQSGDVDSAYMSVDRALALEPWHLQAWLVQEAIASDHGDPERQTAARGRLCTLGVTQAC
jgi:predicted Zn-dependent protease